jgi:sarcosine oxidase subunit alpha
MTATDDRSPAASAGGELVDRSRPVPFRWNGKAYVGLQGDTIVSALLANGVDVFSRSFKYSRPRGVLTASFVDPGCTVQVDDEPNVRAAHRRLARGMDVRPQNVWPSLAFDLKQANQLVGRFLTAGFYYKTFIKPQRLWPAYQVVLSRFAAGGVAGRDSVHGYYDKRYAHVDVVVAGGGPTGMSAAVAAADEGARVLLVEEEYELGGHLRFGGEQGLSALSDLRAQVAARPSIEVMTNAVVTGRYDDNWLAVLQREVGGSVERLVKVRAGALVVAAGLIERPYVFAGNDLPGVMLSTAVRRLVNLYAVKPGDRAVVLSANEEGDAAAADLARVGVEVVRVVDGRTGETIRRATGKGRVQAVELADGTVLQADLLVTATGWTAPTSLLNMAGDRPVWNPKAARFVPSGVALPLTVLATGGLVGDGSPEELAEHGRATGALAVAAPAARRDRTCRCSRSRSTRPCSARPPTASSTSPRTCRARTSWRRPRRATTPASWSSASRPPPWVRPRASSRRSTPSRSWARPPGGDRRPRDDRVAAAVRADQPRRAGRADLRADRVSPLQPWHESSGATPLLAGQWVRPDHYGDAAARRATCARTSGSSTSRPSASSSCRGRTSEAAQPRLRQQVVEARRRRGPLRRHVRRGRRRDGRRRHGPAGRGPLPDVDDLLRRRDGVGVAGELAADRPHGLAGVRDPRDDGLREHQRGRSQVPAADGAARRGGRPVAGGVPVHAGPAGPHRRRRRLRPVAHRLHR